MDLCNLFTIHASLPECSESTVVGLDWHNTVLRLVLETKWVQIYRVQPMVLSHMTKLMVKKVSNRNCDGTVTKGLDFHENVQQKTSLEWTMDLVNLVYNLQKPSTLIEYTHSFFCTPSLRYFDLSQTSSLGCEMLLLITICKM